MTLKELLNAYVKNVIAAVDTGNMSLDCVITDCTLCPVRELCHKTAEENEMSCGEFLKSLIK